MVEHTGKDVNDVALVTIGLTCFNAADSIERALDSALAQDWPNLEIIVVDDLSTDGSADVVAAAIAGEQRARLIRHNVNKGPAGSRNTVLNAATGEYLAFFDDDDESLQGRVSVQVHRLNDYERETGAKLVACYASGERRYDNDYVLELEAIGSQGEGVPHGVGLAQYLLLYRRRPDWFYGTGTPSCALLARRSTFLQAGGFDERLRRVEDADFAVRLALMEGHFVGTPEKLFVQRATHAADKTPEKNLEAELLLAQNNEAFLRSIGFYYYARHWPKLRYWHFKRRYGRFALELIGLLMRHPFAATAHLLETGPKRLQHENRMRREVSS